MDTKIICNIHNQIIQLAESISKISIYRYDDRGDLKGEIDDMIFKIIELTNKALDCGQKMEDRLRDYRETIESLGFKRDKKGVIDKQIKHLKDKIGQLGIELEKAKKNS